MANRKIKRRQADALNGNLVKYFVGLVVELHFKAQGNTLMVHRLLAERDANRGTKHGDRA